MEKERLIGKLNEIIEPVVTNLGYDLYHLEFVKESGENYLRIYIDHSEGISLEDCERVSRPISALLDDNDPISEAYYLEVSSPGIERTLFTDKNLLRYINYDVLIKLNSLIQGKKELLGKLICFDNSNITINSDEQQLIIPREKIKKISLKGDI